MLGFIFALTAAVFVLVLFRRRIGRNRFDWRAWFGFAVGAFVGVLIITVLERFRMPPSFYLFPSWLWQLAAAIVGGFMTAVPIREKLAELLPPGEERGKDHEQRR